MNRGRRCGFGKRGERERAGNNSITFQSLISGVPSLTHQWFMPAAPHSAKRKHTFIHVYLSIYLTLMLWPWWIFVFFKWHTKWQKTNSETWTPTFITRRRQHTNINILFTEKNNKHYFISPTKTDAAALAKQRHLHAADCHRPLSQLEKTTKTPSLS